MCINGGGCESAPPRAMSCLAWNCHGLGNPCAEEELEIIIQAQAPLIVFLSKTWADKNRLEEIRCKIKYAGLFTVPSVDRGGGLALLWKSDIVVWVDSFSKKHIDAVVNGGSLEAWRFTGFYGELDVNHREEAWNMLRLLQSKPHLPWCCMGDFNELLHTEEKKGGRLRPNAQMQAFREALDFCGFIDLGFTGPEFTWHGRRHEYTIWERLDRGVANYDWMSKFPAATVRHLHCYSFDHRPICLLLNPNNEAQRWNKKPFRFEEMWLADRGCGETVLQAWQVEALGTPMFKVTQKLKKCKKLLKTWSRDHFGNVKRQIAKKKEALWKAEESTMNGGSYDLAVSLKRKLNILLDKESHMWRQRARTQWMAQGDNNTKYFHAVATKRKMRNFIKGIRDEGATWRFD